MASVCSGEWLSKNWTDIVLYLDFQQIFWWTWIVISFKNGSHTVDLAKTTKSHLKEIFMIHWKVTEKFSIFSSHYREGQFHQHLYSLCTLFLALHSSPLLHYTDVCFMLQVLWQSVRISDKEDALAQKMFFSLRTHLEISNYSTPECLQIVCLCAGRAEAHKYRFANVLILPSYPVVLLCLICKIFWYIFDYCSQQYYKYNKQALLSPVISKKALT